MNVYIAFLKLAVLTVDVESGLQRDALRTDVLEVHLARIVHLAILIGIADESSQRVALSVESTFRECPFIFHLLVFRVRQEDVELHVNVVD